MDDAPVYVAKVPRRIVRKTIRGIDYAINEWGDRKQPLLVYLHGWGDCGSTFQFVVDELERVFFVVAPDWRGFGQSARNSGPYWFPDYLADLDHLLEHYSPEKPVRLVGHSMGGNVGGLYAGAMPERIIGFANLEGFGLVNSDPATMPKRFRDWIRMTHAPPSFSTYRDFDALAKKVRKRSPTLSAARSMFVARQWAYVGSDQRVRLRTDPAHKMPNAVLYRRAEAEACWRQITAPVLLLAGSESDVLGSADRMAGVAGMIPACRTHCIEGSGHMLHFERPRAVARQLEAFFHL